MSATIQWYKRPLWQIILWVLAFQVLGMLASSLSMPGPWYLKLNKSSLTPANYVFPIAWTFLYTCLAVFGWSLWHHHDTDIQCKRAFTAQMLLNYLWSPVFFSLHQVTLALWMIVAMIFLSFYMIVHSIQNKIFTWFLLVPYIAWLAFAYYLTSYILAYL
jgi:benzodiazapine receptor